MARKKGSVKRAAEPLVALREMSGPAVVSMVVDQEEAVARVASGFQPLGMSGDRVILVADAEAVAAWESHGGSSDE